MSTPTGRNGQPAMASIVFSTMSDKAANETFEIIDSAELASRWRVPESWIRNHTRARTSAQERIPCVRFGRYVRFEWVSPDLKAWLEKHRE